MNDSHVLVDQLLSDVCDGRATSDEWNQLNLTLDSDASAMDRYISYNNLHALLATEANLFASEFVTPVPESRGGIKSSLRPGSHPWRFALAVTAVTLLFWASLIGLTAFNRGDQHHAVAPAVRPPTETGRIARLHEVRWSAGSIVYRRGETLFAGDRLSLDQGLVEIKLPSGTTCVLEGPGELKLEAAESVKLLLGKFVARIDDPDSRFVVETPTARFEDLGTEFGVDVDAQGESLLHVFEGRVRASPLDGDMPSKWVPQMVLAGQTVTVASEQLREAVESDLVARGFRRELPAEDIVLDLVDIVSGGDGTRRGVDRGVRLTDGASVESFAPGYQAATGTFADVDDSRFIDGVFVLSKSGEVDQIDSAGTKYSFSPNSGGSWGTAWAFEQSRPDQPSSWIHPLPKGVGRFVALHSNAGMTIDLQALRSTQPGFAPKRFFAHANNQFFPVRDGLGNRVDVFVLVDGEPRLVHKQLASGGETIRIDVPLAPDDRFLTLAVTDGGDGLTCDFMLWRQPQIVLGEIPEDRSVSESQE